MIDIKTKDTFEAYTNYHDLMTRNINLHIRLVEPVINPTEQNYSSVTEFNKDFDSINSFFYLQNWAASNGYHVTISADPTNLYEFGNQTFTKRFDFIAFIPEWNECGLPEKEKVAFTGAFINHGKHLKPEWEMHT